MNTLGTGNDQNLINPGTFSSPHQRAGNQHFEIGTQYNTAFKCFGCWFPPSASETSVQKYSLAVVETIPTIHIQEVLWSQVLNSSSEFWAILSHHMPLICSQPGIWHKPIMLKFTQMISKSIQIPKLLLNLLILILPVTIHLILKILQAEVCCLDFPWMLTR